MVAAAKQTLQELFLQPTQVPAGVNILEIWVILKIHKEIINLVYFKIAPKSTDFWVRLWMFGIQVYGPDDIWS